MGETTRRLKRRILRCLRWANFGFLPAESRIPRNVSYPSDAVQCDECGGLGETLDTDAPAHLMDIDCPVCAGNGWLPAGHPRGRKCGFCKRPLEPDRFQVYCSNECAYADAQAGGHYEDRQD